MQSMVQRVNRCTVTKETRARSRVRSWDRVRQWEKATEYAHSARSGGFPMASESAVAKRGKGQQLCHQVLTIKGVTLEGVAGLIGIPWGLIPREVQVLDRDIAPRVAGAAGASLPSLRRVKVRGPA